MIRQNFARAEPADALLDRLHRVMDRTPRLALSYSDLDEAAKLIRGTFAAWPPKLDGCLSPAERTPDTAEGNCVATPRSTAPRPAVAAQPGRQAPPRGRRGLPRRPRQAAIHHLNVIGTGLWNLLANGTDQNEAVEVLHGAFPDVDHCVIARDVAELFSALAAADFIVPADDRSA